VNPFRATRRTEGPGTGRSASSRRGRLLRRIAYTLAGLTILLVVVSLTAGDDRVLGSPADFERLARAPFGRAILRGNLERNDLSEASGIAASRLQDDLFWVVNDSGNGPILYAVGADGRDRGALPIEGAKNRDWEDIASYRVANGSDGSGDARCYLVIADIGDNRSRRKKVTLYFVEEPVLRGDAFAEGSAAKVAFRQQLEFEDGPRDAEAIAVDPAGGEILIVSKRNVPAEVYSLPLPSVKGGVTATDEVAVAKRIALLTIPQPTEEDLEEDFWQGRYRSQPTALDIEKGERGAMILTYKNAYYYPRAAGESWGGARARAPARLKHPPLEQSEAGAFSRDGQSFFTTTEKRPAPIFESVRE
jgi:hypothetical protein